MKYSLNVALVPIMVKKRKTDEIVRACLTRNTKVVWEPIGEQYKIDLYACEAHLSNLFRNMMGICIYLLHI